VTENQCLIPGTSAGGMLSWFLTTFECRGGHGCGEQQNIRGTMVYIGSSIHEDKNPISCVCWLYYD
jgi:hypothetical protein